jgi:hypothetical protein
MKPLLVALALLLAVDDDLVVVTLVFEKMHCEECKTTLQAQLKQSQKNVKDVVVEGETATLRMMEGTPLDLTKLRRAVPSDLKVKSIGLSARGTVTSRGSELRFQPRDAAVEYPLVNREEKPKEDRVEALRKELGGKNRFEIAGELREKDKATQIVLTGFKKADWKEK